jgi:hypothetical protein
MPAWRRIASARPISMSACEADEPRERPGRDRLSERSGGGRAAFTHPFSNRLASPPSPISGLDRRDGSPLARTPFPAPAGPFGTPWPRQAASENPREAHPAWTAVTRSKRSLPSVRGLWDPKWPTISFPRSARPTALLGLASCRLVSPAQPASLPHPFFTSRPHDPMTPGCPIHDPQVLRLVSCRLASPAQPAGPCRRFPDRRGRKARAHATPANARRSLPQTLNQFILPKRIKMI